MTRFSRTAATAGVRREDIRPDADDARHVRAHLLGVRLLPEAVDRSLQRNDPVENVELALDPSRRPESLGVNDGRYRMITWSSIRSTPLRYSFHSEPLSRHARSLAQKGCAVTECPTPATLCRARLRPRP